MYAQIREDIITAVKAPFEAAFPGVAIVFDNAPFDWNAPPDRYVCVELSTQYGRTIGMRAEPKTRISGFIYVEAHSRAGLGSKWGTTVHDWFASTLEYKRKGVAQIQHGEPDGNTTSKGFYIQSLKLYFYADPA